MSTSDQQGDLPLTRKQLREIRLTGATPVISEAEAAAAAETPPAQAESAPGAEQPVPDATVEVSAPNADAGVATEDAPLTRRQVREQERIRTASVPVIAPETSAEASEAEDVVSGVPAFEPPTANDDRPINFDDDDDLDEEAVDVEPVSAAVADDELPVADDDLPVVDDEPPVADPVETGENPVVSPTFGNGLLSQKPATDQADTPSFTPSFDELITADSGGSQHLAPNTLIFNPSPGGGSLSGPVASTGEILVTGSYELPRGIGSQGHAPGTADGKEADAVLLDGELHPSSSPTPIAASSAISTIKPAGEVIRPPAPEKGNKLMLTLAITAGGLALALAVALIVAFTTNIFS